ncbi:MAG: hypothetical protein EP335_11490 [Alphaproteobacteria bacterium]|nr:MAG: hypothetical protein EP335_11490 [Alphaproteobacteria bacterium]
MAKQQTGTLSSKNWLGRASAGLILGFGIAIGLSALFAHFGPGGFNGESTKMQMTMWMTSPIWVTVLCCCFLFQTGLRAWLWLGATNIFIFAAYFGGRALVT